VLHGLLSESGLNYGALPKALLKFHGYGPEEAVRTPLEEHLVEAAHYCRRNDATAHVHFTVSPSHLDALQQRVHAVRSLYEARHDVTFVVSYSVQKPATDTIAVNLDNTPFRLDDGSLLFRTYTRQCCLLYVYIDVDICIAVVLLLLLLLLLAVVDDE
jgi:hypothetical protein